MHALDAHRLDEAIEAPVALIYKHSPACGLSFRTWREVEAFHRANAEVPVYWVDVIGQRPLSQDMAHRLDVPHASPQVILMAEGEPVWDASHMGVNQSSIERAVLSLR